MLQKGYSFRLPLRSRTRVVTSRTTREQLVSDIIRPVLKIMYTHTFTTVRYLYQMTEQLSSSSMFLFFNVNCDLKSRGSIPSAACFSVSPLIVTWRFCRSYFGSVEEARRNKLFRGSCLKRYLLVNFELLRCETVDIALMTTNTHTVWYYIYIFLCIQILLILKRSLLNQTKIAILFLCFIYLCKLYTIDKSLE